MVFDLKCYNIIIKSLDIGIYNVTGLNIPPNTNNSLSKFILSNDVVDFHLRQTT